MQHCATGQSVEISAGLGTIEYIVHRLAPLTAVHGVKHIHKVQI